MSVLDGLRSESLETASSSISTAEGLRDFLSRRLEVLELRRTLATGGIVIDDVRNFVQHLLQDFRPNEKFAGDYILAAIAVALESFPGAFADEYLSDLASLHIREMPLAPRVARLAVQQRETSVSEATWREKILSIPDVRELRQPTEWKPIPVSAQMDHVDHQMAA